MLKRISRSVGLRMLNVVDSWEGGGGKYVSQFQKNLDALACDLSQVTGRWMLARYNNLTGCAEIFCPCDRTVAWVIVHGEMCLPITVHVSLPFLPAQHIQALFEKHLHQPLTGSGPTSGMEIRFHAFA